MPTFSKGETPILLPFVKEGAAVQSRETGTGRWGKNFLNIQMKHIKNYSIDEIKGKLPPLLKMEGLQIALLFGYLLKTGEINTTPTIHKIPLIPPLPKGEIVIPLFGKEGRGEIF